MGRQKSVRVSALRALEKLVPMVFEVRLIAQPGSIRRSAGSI
jgi:hypothetical protein